MQSAGNPRHQECVLTYKPNIFQTIKKLKCNSIKMKGISVFYTILHNNFKFGFFSLVQIVTGGYLLILSDKIDSKESQ